MLHLLCVALLLSLVESTVVPIDSNGDAYW